MDIIDSITEEVFVLNKKRHGALIIIINYESRGKNLVSLLWSVQNPSGILNILWIHPANAIRSCGAFPTMSDEWQTLLVNGSLIISHDRSTQTLI